MSRSIVGGLVALAGAMAIATPAAATTAITTPAAGTAPARAEASAAKVVYGFAWADGPRTLRITPLKPRLVRGDGGPSYRLGAIKGAKELRVRYAGADVRRVTAECRLKETEGVVRVDRNGLGRTRCTDADLAVMLGVRPLAVKITLGPRVLVQEFRAPSAFAAQEAYGTAERVNDNTVLFRTRGRTIKLGYTDLVFERVTRRCGDRWLANRTRASRDGLGTRFCAGAHFTRALRRAGGPVRVKAGYYPLAGWLTSVSEVTRR